MNRPPTPPRSSALLRLLAPLALALLTLPACKGGASVDPVAVGDHGGVEWAPWEPASFEQAAAQDKLILINVVATWCHWCHVMEETTYADPRVAAILREHFVTIRVDSDARPDVAERYRRWGWPATALLSPQAEPVINLRGYREPEVFAAILLELVEDKRDGELEPRIAQPESKAVDESLEALRTRAAAQLDAYYDPRGLGWGGKQKYPWPDPVEYAFLRARLRGEAGWREQALKTLEAERALIDPVWGGMYQYSLRGVWDRPHYEKIAMIQAGAVENYAHAAMITGQGRWLEPAGEVRDYLLERWQDREGGFYTSQDADLRREGQATVVGADYYALDAAGREALGEPRVDTAVYADLNALIIHALTELWRAEPDPVVREAAIRAGERLLRTHRRESGGFSHGPGPDGATGGLLHLADQAAVGWALLGLYRITGEARWREAAVELAEFMAEELRAPAGEGGGFYAHTRDPEAVGVFAERRKPLDQNALAAQFLIELHQLEDGDGSLDTPWLELAREALLAVGSPEQIEARGKVVGRYLYALDLLAATKVDLSVVAEPDDPAGDALWRAALSVWAPRVSVERSRPGERYPKLEHAAVYLCTDRACSKPLSDPATLPAEAQAFLLDVR